MLAARNLVHIHDWGDSDCCPARGARDLWLYVTAPAGADLAASRPDFVAGEYLLLEEVLGPRTGLPQDADPRNRQVVRIEAVEDAADPVFGDLLVGGVLTPAGAGDPPLPLLHVHLREVDATAMPFCLSAEDPLSHQLIAPITIIRGNVTPSPTTAGRSCACGPIPPTRRWSCRRRISPRAAGRSTSRACEKAR